MIDTPRPPFSMIQSVNYRRENTEKEEFEIALQPPFYFFFSFAFLTTFTLLKTRGALHGSPIL
jgi:hypothetical protein